MADCSVRHDPSNANPAARTGSEGADRRAAERKALLRLAGAAVASYWAPALSLPVVGLRPTFGVIDRVSPGPHVALTFDDGPHRRGTTAVLEALRAAEARATFFLVGEQIQATPELAAAIVAARHEVGVHCYRHRNLLLRTPGMFGHPRRAAVRCKVSGLLSHEALRR